MPEDKHEFDEQEETRTISIVFDEYTVSKTNRDPINSEFESLISMFDNERIEKNFDWYSDIPIPEFPSEELTQISIDVGQYFQTRDFVETYVQDPSQEALSAADASEELINRTLNRRDLYHYQKFVRAKSLSNIVGEVYAECGWERVIGDRLEDILKDQFWYDVIDNRNVFMDNKYCYSLQQKDYVIIRTEKTLHKLEQEKDRNGYFNLGLLKDLKPTGSTETKRETLDRDNSSGTNIPQNKVSEYFDVYKRYGLFWIMEDESPGIDQNGDIKKGASLKETIITIACNGGTKILIGCHETPYIDAYGNPFRPIFRGLCYIHPTKDNGVGDGHYAKPLAIAINDTFNVSQIRTLLATMPTLKGKKYVTDETDTIYWEPNHLMEVVDPDDIQEFTISDNISAALQQLGILTNKMQQTTSIYPTTMGDIPKEASTSATAVVGASQRTNQRSNYKSLTFEYTFLNELYWMIQQMTWQFAKPETGYMLMGDKVINFNPMFDFFYKPLSQSIETGESRQMKIKQLTVILQSITNSQHPDMPIIFNYILAQIITLMGDEYVNISDKFLGTDVPLQNENRGSPPRGEEGIGNAPSNQYQLPQGNLEAMTRENANAY